MPPYLKKKESWFFGWFHLVSYSSKEPFVSFSQTESETVSFRSARKCSLPEESSSLKHTHISSASYCFPLTVSSSAGPVRSSAPTEICPSVTQPLWPGIRAKPPWPWLSRREARLWPERKREGEIILFWAGPAEGTVVLTRRGHPWSVHWAMRWPDIHAYWAWQIPLLLTG